MYDTSHPNDIDTPGIEARTALYLGGGAAHRGHPGARPLRRFAALAVTSSGGVCLAIGFLLERTGFRLHHVQIPPALGEAVENAGLVLLVTASIAILIVVGFTVRCLWKAVEYGGGQDLANRWLDVATRGVYLACRLTENRSRDVRVDRHFAVDSTSLSASLTGQNCTVILVDIVDYGARTRGDQDRRTIRVALYQIVQGTFADADFWLRDCHLEDRGDGILLVIPPPVPTSSVVNHILGDLVDLLRQHNELTTEATRIQMRIALHVGPVVSDAHGVDGRAIIYTARLLEASALKEDVAQSGADLGFITSDFVYDTIIQPSSGPVDPGAYRHLQSQVKNDPIHAWVYLTQAAS
jgi:class 3 adenylate cyclase